MPVQQAFDWAQAGAFDFVPSPSIVPPGTLPVGEGATPVPGRTVFVRHRRARRYVLRVLDDGTARVTLPWRGTLGEARRFLVSQHEWIERQRGQRRVRAESAAASALRPMVERWHRARAERELPARLAALAAMHGISVSGVSVRNQRSRWGACSSRGRITLNWRLILAPDFVRDYVMLHELMHRRELNHSRRFWRLVAECCPDHLAARRWLKREGKMLWADGR